jgi:putative transport protein
MNWIFQLFTQHSIAQTILIYSLVISTGIWLGRLKFFNIALGVTWVLFVGLLFSHFGIVINKEIGHFLKEFGLILFVYSIGLQVGPGFFASLKKNALSNNILAAIAVLLGVIFTIVFYLFSNNSIAVMAGVMSGAVTNTPGLAAAQAAIKDLHITNANTETVTQAYAVAYPLGVFGIILSIISIKKILGINIENQKELHKKLDLVRNNKPVSIHLTLQNKQLDGKPLRKIFELAKDHFVVSRILQNNTIITPTPDTVVHENNVLLIVANKTQIESLKLLIGNQIDIDLKAAKSNLVSKLIVVTQPKITHKRLGDIVELHQHDFTLTRLNRAGVELVPHGDIYLQLGDTIKVVGTEDGINEISKVVGNSIKKLEVPDIAPIFLGIVLGVVLGSMPFTIPNIPIPVKIGMAGGPLIVALFLSKFGSKVYLNNYTTYSANLMIRELGIALFLASVGLQSGSTLGSAFASGIGFKWMAMGLVITTIPLIITGILAQKLFKKTYFETCGILAGASTDPPALAFALKMAGNDVPSATYATVYPLTMILRILAAQLLILFLS